MPNPFSLVVAYARTTRGIGIRTHLPWPRLPTDLARFAKLTTPHTVVMGRVTFLSPEVGGQALPRRRNVVLSRDALWVPPPGVVRATDWDEALHLAQHGFGGAGYDDGARVLSPDARRDPPRHVFVVGGELVYRRALKDPMCQWVFATEIAGAFDSDTYFPPLDPKLWLPVPPKDCPREWASDDVFVESSVPFYFCTFRRDPTAAASDKEESANR